MGELLIGRLWRQQPDAGALLRTCLGEHELSAALEAKTEGRGFWPLSAGDEVTKSPGRHQVHEQDELAILGRKQQPLAAALDP